MHAEVLQPQAQTAYLRSSVQPHKENQPVTRVSLAVRMHGVSVAVSVLPSCCACCEYVLPTVTSCFWAAAECAVIILDFAIEAARLSRVGPMALGYEVTNLDESVMASQFCSRCAAQVRSCLRMWA